MILVRTARGGHPFLRVADSEAGGTAADVLPAEGGLDWGSVAGALPTGEMIEKLKLLVGGERIGLSHYLGELCGHRAPALIVSSSRVGVAEGIAPSSFRRGPG